MKPNWIDFKFHYRNLSCEGHDLYVGKYVGGYVDKLIG
jgi:hypothetical protein